MLVYRNFRLDRRKFYCHQCSKFHSFRSFERWNGTSNRRGHRDWGHDRLLFHE